MRNPMCAPVAKGSSVSTIVSAERAWIEEFEAYLLQDGRSLSQSMARALATLGSDTRCLIDALQRQEAIKGRRAPESRQEFAAGSTSVASNSITSRSRVLRIKLLRLRRAVQRGTEEAKARRDFVSLITLSALARAHQRTAKVLSQYSSTVRQTPAQQHAAA